MEDIVSDARIQPGQQDTNQILPVVRCIVGEGDDDGAVQFHNCKMFRIPRGYRVYVYGWLLGKLCFKTLSI